MPESHPTRVPLFWLLFPIAAGIASSAFHGAQLAFAIFLFASIASALAWGSSIGQRTWITLLCGSLFLTGFAYAAFTDASKTARSPLPEREVEVSLSTDRLFEAQSDRARGFGRIVAAPPHLIDLIGSRVYFSLYRISESDESETIQTGSTLRARGLLTPVGQAAPEGAGFDNYLKASGISFQLSRGVVLEADHSRKGWRSRFDAIQNWAFHWLTHTIDSESDPARAYVAMMLGKKSVLEEDRKALFLQSGALHLFAISGLHIGVIAACGHATLILFRFPRIWIPVPNLALILVFVLMTGGAPSAWRALLMIACYYLCLATNRQSASLNALALSALICLLVDPHQLFLAGFQMSYATVAAILLYGVPLSDSLIERWTPFSRLPRKFWNWQRKSIYEFGRFLIGSLSISLSAFLASSALSIAYFNTLPLAGILANVVLLPLAFLTIVAGFLALAFASLSAGPIVSLFNHAAQVSLSLMHRFLEALSQLPSHYLTFESPSIALQLALLTLLLAFLLYGYDRQWRFPRQWLCLFPISYSCLCIAAAIL